MKKINFFSAGLVFLFVIGMISSCNHETEEFDGPSLIDRFGPFAATSSFEVSQPTVDFANGETAFFSITFNKKIEWVLEITGSESGAVKRIEGFSNALDATNTNWDGGTTDLPFFKTEMCTVALRIPEEPTFAESGVIEALSSKRYGGALITDFEENQPGVIQRNYDFKFSSNTGRRDDLIAGQGDFQLFIEGTNNGVADPYFIGLYEILASVTGETYLPVPTSVPEDLYFNFLVYNDGRPYGIAIVDFAVDTNDDGEFNANLDELINPFGETRLDWEGWRLISFPMNTVGNITQEQLQKLVAARLILISDHGAQPVPAEPVGFGTDFMIFTQGGPLEL